MHMLSWLIRDHVCDMRYKVILMDLPLTVICRGIIYSLIVCVACAFVIQLLREQNI